MRNFGTVFTQKHKDELRNFVNIESDEVTELAPEK